MIPQTFAERRILETLIRSYNTQSRTAAYWKACDHPQWSQYENAAGVLLDAIVSLFDAAALTFAFDNDNDNGVRFTWKRLTYA